MTCAGKHIKHDYFQKMCQWQTIRNGIVTDTLNPDIGECKTKTRRNEANEPIPLLIASCAEGYGGMERAHC